MSLFHFLLLIGLQNSYVFRHEFMKVTINNLKIAGVSNHKNKFLFVIGVTKVNSPQK